jgi:hypothetical protein
MAAIYCQTCRQAVTADEGEPCPHCGEPLAEAPDLEAADRQLRARAARLIEERAASGAEEPCGGLEAVIINVEPQRFLPAVYELLHTTGLEARDSFEDETFRTCVLGVDGGADLLVRARLKEANPFSFLNGRPRSRHLPNTRLESLVFRADDLDRTVERLRGRGVGFLGTDIEEAPGFRFIQTVPSAYTGNSTGYLERGGDSRSYRGKMARSLELDLPAAPRPDYLQNIGTLDHAATRIHASDREAAILEFMNLTSYRFAFSIYVKSLNSITNVTRLEGEDYAMVFTSGIADPREGEEPGPTEGFIQGYGTRVHHLAFATRKIVETFARLKADGLEFLVELVGSEEEGLRQTFTRPSPHTLLVNEYITRYGDFDGFFTRSNVKLLTAATGRQ